MSTMPPTSSPTPVVPTFPLLSRIVGAGFIRDRIPRNALPEGATLVVLHEQNNPHDPFALKVHARHPLAPEVSWPLGWVPSSQARQLFPLLRPRGVGTPVPYFPATFAISSHDPEILILAPVNPEGPIT